MRRALMHSTRIAVQVAVEDDTGGLTGLILAITALVNLMIGLGRIVNQVNLFVSDFAAGLDFVSKVYVIGFKALAFGFVGVRL